MMLIESASDLAQLKKVCGNGQFMVEANDMSAVHALSSRTLPFITGLSANIYHGYTLKMLSDIGLKRWVLPVELSRTHVRDILCQAEQQCLEPKYLAMAICLWLILPAALQPERRG